jgi:amine acid ABC transporter, permease protein, 3-TM region, His/Glu/Gln/Arg/opine family
MAINLNFETVFAYWPQFLSGAGLTLRLSLLAMVVGLAIAIPCAWARVEGPAALRRAVRGYVEIIRNTPLLIQIYIVFFGLPGLGVRMSADSAALVALSLNVGAYSTEIIRSGIQSINKGQVEAAKALGLGALQTFRFVVLRPALRNIYPALTSQFIILMLFSSLVSVIAANDLSSVANHVQSVTFRSFEVYIVVTAIYFVLSSGLSGVFSLIFQRFIDYPTR